MISAKKLKINNTAWLERSASHGLLRLPVILSQYAKYAGKKREIDMQNCEYCNYLRCSSETNHGIRENNIHVCTFCGVIISAGQSMTETEYPCENISYDEYLIRNKKDGSGKKQEESWKVQYKNRRPYPGKKNFPIAV
jgi:hypothetical protein